MADYSDDIAKLLFDLVIIISTYIRLSETLHYLQLSVVS